MPGSSTRWNRCQAVAPSTRAVSSTSSGTAASPASSSSATSGVLFHTSVAMTTANDDQRSASQARSDMKDSSGVAAYFQANSATTGMIPYGSSNAARTDRRPTAARRSTSAMANPSTSSAVTATAVITAVAPRSVQNTGAASTAV